MCQPMQPTLVLTLQGSVWQVRVFFVKLIFSDDVDSDGDGLSDAVDDDDDNDGILDDHDDDDDGDGILDNDEDDDGDGIENDGNFKF